MKVAISMCCLHDFFVRKELDSLSFIKYAASLMVDGVELCDCYLPSLTDLNELKGSLAESNLKVASYALTKGSWTLESLKGELETAKNLGAETIRLAGEFSSVKELIPELERLKITLCVAEENLALDFKHPLIKSTFIMAEACLQGRKPHDRVGQVRANDLRLASHEPGDYIGSVLGLGLVKLEPLLQELEDLDYLGWLIVDYSGEENPLFGLEASLKNLRQYLREL